jgi:ABC-type Fe3+ transport system permease subunit
VAEYLYRSLNGGDTRVAMALYSAVFLGMSVGFGVIFEWTLHGDRVYQPVPRDKHWAARLRFVGGGGVYVLAIVVALVNAIAAFVIMGVVAVYYVLEHTPAASGETGAEEPPGDEPDVGVR